jgi:hypothetical protein
LITAVVGLALMAAGGFASAQGFRADVASSAALTVETSAGTLDAVEAAQVDAAVSTAGIFTAGAALAALSEEGTKVDLALAGDDASMVAQTPPTDPTPEGAAVAAQPILVNERAWSDGVKTIVECTGDVTRTCQVNVYGPDGEFILGRKISPSGEAADCEGPCLDATGAALDAATAVQADVAVSDVGVFSAGVASSTLQSEEGTKVDLAMGGDEAGVTVAQIPSTPAAPEGMTASAQPILVNERVWSDGVKTVVECTGDVVRTCQANVYGPDGEFILGRKISPSGEAADCSGPCLDASGAPLDAATVTRAQAAAGAGAPTHKVITSAGLPTPPVVTVSPAETEADVLRHEGE